MFGKGLAHYEVEENIENSYIALLNFFQLCKKESMLLRGVHTFVFYLRMGDSYTNPYKSKRIE
jgi:hypothetical protein